MSSREQRSHAMAAVTALLPAPSSSAARVGTHPPVSTLVETLAAQERVTVLSFSTTPARRACVCAQRVPMRVRNAVRGCGAVTLRVAPVRRQHEGPSTRSMLCGMGGKHSTRFVCMTASDWCYFQVYQHAACPYLSGFAPQSANSSWFGSKRLATASTEQRSSTTPPALKCPPTSCAALRAGSATSNMRIRSAGGRAHRSSASRACCRAGTPAAQRSRCRETAAPRRRRCRRPCRVVPVLAALAAASAARV
jgi:hypothetical protein